MTWSLATGTLRDDEESRAFLQDRSVFLGRVGALFFAAVTLLRTVVLLGNPRAGDWALLEIAAVVLALATVYAGVWVACRSRPRTPSVLRATGATALVLAGVTIGCFPLAATPFVDTVYPMVIATAYVLSARAVIVPSTPARTLALSVAVGRSARDASPCFGPGADERLRA